jgi:hypothetical protein
MSYPELQNILPSWLVKARYGQQYWNFISTEFKTYQERRIFLRAEFDQMIDLVKSGHSHPLTYSITNSLSEINNEIINANWKKIIQRSKTDPEGAITASKTMMETVFKFILDEESESYTKQDDFNDLYLNVKKVLKLDPKNHNVQTFKQTLSGITSVVQGFGSLRNDYEDSHGKGKDSFYPEERHVELVINLTASLCSFLIDTYRSKIKK